MYERTEKLALHIHSLQANANIFKVLRNSLRMIFIRFLYSLLLCRLQRKVKITEGCIAHYFEYIAFTFIMK